MNFDVSQADLTDCDEILALQKLAYQSEAALYDDWSIPPLTQTIEQLREEVASQIALKAVANGQIVGSVRASEKNKTCHIGRLIVHPDFQRQGIGTQLMRAIEGRFARAARFELFTGDRSAGNIRLYQRRGYSIFRKQQLSPIVTLVFMQKNGTTDA